MDVTIPVQVASEIHHLVVEEGMTHAEASIWVARSLIGEILDEQRDDPDGWPREHLASFIEEVLDASFG